MKPTKLELTWTGKENQPKLEPLLLAGWIERNIPDKPRSSNQKYLLTEKGRKALKNYAGGKQC